MADTVATTNPSAQGSMEESDVHSGGKKTNPKQYKTNPSRTTMHGEYYEVRVTALLYLRALKSGRPFQLATNVDGAGALGNIFFRFQTADNPPVWHTCFMQIKHKRSADFSLNVKMFKYPAGKFALKTFYKSYLGIKETMSSANEEILFDGPFDTCTFALYTNAEFDKESERKRAESSSEVDEFLFSDTLTKEQKNVFNFTEVEDSDVYASLNKEGEEAKWFLKKFRLFTKQPSKDELVDKIKIGLRSHCKRDQLDIDSVYRIFDFEMTNRWQASEGTLIDQDDDILKNVLIEARIEVLTHKCKEKFRLDVTFNKSSITQLANKCTEDFVNIVTNASSLTNIANKLLQMLESVKTSYIFLVQDCKETDFHDMLTIWKRKSESKNLFVFVNTIENEKLTDKSKAMCDKICAVLESNQDKCMIMLTPPRNECAKQFLEKLGVRGKTFSDQFLFSQLEKESAENIMNKMVTFQGKNIPIRKLFDYNTQLASDHIKTLLESGPCILGQDLPKVIDYYIPRTLEWKPVINDVVLLEEAKASEDEFIIGVQSNDDPIVQSTTSISVVIDDSNRNNIKDSIKKRSKALTEKSDSTTNGSFQRTTVHYLKQINSELIWEDSDGNSNSIRQYIDKAETRIVDVETVLKRRCNLLVAGPGMGKTTFLCYLSHHIQKKHPEYWVLFIELGDHALLFSKMVAGIIDAKEFLVKAIGYKKMPALDKALFDHKFNSNRMVVILDGFDEVAPRYESKCLALVTNLLKSNVEHLWISTRYSIKAKLENICPTLPVTLRYFNQADQVTFLCSQWEKSSSLSRHELEDFIVKLLKIAAQSFNDSQNQFTGLPLQTYMLSKIFQTSVSESTPELPEIFDSLSLIEGFVKIKFALAAVKSHRIAEESDLFEDFVEELMESTEEHHMTAARIYLDDQNTPSKSEQYDSFIVRIRTGKEKVGLIHRIVDDKPVFVHSVFAIYFTALWYSKNFTNIEKIYITPSWNLVGNLLDRILAKGYPLHTAVLNNDLNKVESLSKELEKVSERDKGARTPLHLAVINNSEGYSHEKSDVKTKVKMLQIFLSLDNNFNLEDDILKWTPLQYADATKNWDALEVLFSRTQPNLDQLKITKNYATMTDMLEYLVRHDYCNFILVLLRLGLSIDGFHDFGRTSLTLLHKAAELGSLKVATLLVCEKKCSLRITDSEHQTPLHKAAKNNHLDIVKLLVSYHGLVSLRSLYINAVDINGCSALHLAVEGGNDKVVSFLIESGASWTEFDGSELTPLMKASLSGNVAIVETLVRTFTDSVCKCDYINKRNQHSQSSMHLAASNGHTNVIKILITGGGEVTTVDKFGFTPLMKATERGQTSVVQTLLSTFKDNNARVEHIQKICNDGRNALHLAKKRKHVEIDHIFMNILNNLGLKSERTPLMTFACSGDFARVKHILNNIADPNQKVNYVNIFEMKGLSALMLASENNHVDIVKYLISSGADLQHQDIWGWSPLMTASNNNCLSVVRYLVNYFADEINRTKYINKHDDDHQTALLLSCEAGHYEVSAFLIENGADVTVQDSSQWTPLMRATSIGNKSLVQLLLDSCDQSHKTEYIQMTTKKGVSAFKISLKKGYHEIAELLRNTKYAADKFESKSLFAAAKIGIISKVKQLLSSVPIDSKSDVVNAVGLDGTSALLISSENGHHDVVQLLLTSGADPNVYDKWGWTPLMAASQNNHLQVVQSLLNSFKDDDDKKAYVNKPDGDGQRALQLSAERGHFDVCKFLIEAGANITAQDKYGLTPLMRASLNGHTSVVIYLLDINTLQYYVNIVDRYHKHSALHLSAERGHHVIAKMLIQSGGDLNARNMLGWTPLMIATFNNHVSVVKVLLSTVCDKDRHSALSLAKEIENNEIIKVLET